MMMTSKKEPLSKILKARCQQFIFMEKMKASSNKTKEVENEIRYKNMDTSSLLVAVPIFHCLSKEQHLYLASKAEIVTSFSEEIKYQNSDDDYIYIIKSGKVLIHLFDRKTGEYGAEEMKCNPHRISTNLMVSMYTPIKEQNLGPGDTIGISEVLLKQKQTIQIKNKSDINAVAIQAKYILEFQDELLAQLSVFENTKDFSLTNEGKLLSKWIKFYMNDVQAYGYKKSIPEQLQQKGKKLFSQSLLLFSPENTVYDIFKGIWDLVCHWLFSSQMNVYFVGNSNTMVYLYASTVRICCLCKIEATIKFWKRWKKPGILDQSDEKLIQDVLKTKSCIMNKNFRTPENSTAGSSCVMCAPIFDVNEVQYVVEVFVSDETKSDEYSSTFDLFKYMVEHLEVYFQEFYSYNFYSKSLIFSCDVNSKLEFSIEDIQLSNKAISQMKCTEFVLVITLVHGKDTLATPVKIFRKSIKKQDFLLLEILECISINIQIGDIPLAAQILLQLFKGNRYGIDTRSGGPLGQCNFPVFTYTHHLQQGKFLVEFIPGRCDRSAAPSAQCERLHPTIKDFINIKFTSFDKKILFGKRNNGYNKRRNTDNHVRFGSRISQTYETHLFRKYSTKFQVRVVNLLRDPLETLSEGEKRAIWLNRDQLKYSALSLPIFLLSTDWSSSKIVDESYEYMYKWQSPSFLQALQLLSDRFADRKVRAHAVHCLDSLSDKRVALFLSQLIQCLKYEPYDDSSLARFLLARAISNPEEIGYPFFWALQAEIDLIDNDRGVKVKRGAVGKTLKKNSQRGIDTSLSKEKESSRFRLLLNEYLKYCGSYKIDIQLSIYVMDKLEDIARQIKKCKSYNTRNETLKFLLSSTFFPEIFQLPLTKKIILKRIIPEKCRVLVSKKKPIYMHIETIRENEPPLLCILKVGDDLRQDQFTLQILRIMDDLWQAEGIELHLSPYECCSTGDSVGLIQVVENAETLANILYKKNRLDKNNRKITTIMRKFKTVKDTFVEDYALLEWLLSDVKFNEKNQLLTLKEKSKQPEAKQVIEMFGRSCAGYCVATFILGVADRHSDNVMLQKSGRLFHIDFGHFLGNFKSKMGIKRDRAPFIFTPAMAMVLGGPNDDRFLTFVELACDAYDIIRKNAGFLLTLFALMIKSKLPELQAESDLDWIRKALVLNLPEKEARLRFKELIYEAMTTKTILINDAMHILNKGCSC